MKKSLFSYTAHNTTPENPIFMIFDLLDLSLSEYQNNYLYIK